MQNFFACLKHEFSPQKYFELFQCKGTFQSFLQTIFQVSDISSLIRVFTLKKRSHLRPSTCFEKVKEFCACLKAYLILAFIRTSPKAL